MGNACYGPREAATEKNTEAQNDGGESTDSSYADPEDQSYEEEDTETAPLSSGPTDTSSKPTGKKPKIAPSTLKVLATGATFTKFSEKSGKAHKRDFFIRQEDKERDIAVTGLLVWAKKGKRQQKDPRATIKLINLTSISTDKSNKGWTQGDAANADESKVLTFNYTAQSKGQEQQKFALFEANTVQERDLWADTLTKLMERRDYIQANQQS